MHEIIALTCCLTPSLSARTLRQLRHIIAAMLPMTGRVTTVGLSRWTEKGGSVRTLQRWMQISIEWGAVLWAVVCAHLLDGGKEYILAADEVVVSKSGKKPHGLGRFYSSLAQRPISGVSFLASFLALRRHSCCSPCTPCCIIGTGIDTWIRITKCTDAISGQKIRQTPR